MNARHVNHFGHLEYLNDLGREKASLTSRPVIRLRSGTVFSPRNFEWLYISVMVDVFSSQKRSEVMSHIKSKGNASTELLLIKLFKKYHITGWRRNQKIFGKPDFVFKKQKIAVFTDGCFWHGHNCKNVTPKINAEFWRNKHEKNKKRDRLVNATLKEEGWRVIRIWECKIKNKNLPKQLINLLTTENRLGNR